MVTLAYQEGDFEDLGRVACETKAAANILSKARLLDAGSTVSHDQSNDVYQLQGHQRSYTFSRKVLQDGRRSSHYACDMADTDHTFVTTVADNMRQYINREVAQTKTARQLMARRLGTVRIVASDYRHARHDSTTADDVCPVLRVTTVGNPENTPSTKRTIDEVRT
jgi:hypothetical protein